MTTVFLPATASRRVIQREAGRWWWAPLVGAAIWFVVAWLVLRADYTSLTTVGVIVGVAFLVAAINETALAAVMDGGWAVWHVLLAIVLFLGALWAFVRPINTFFALASMLGLLLLLQGLFTITRGIDLRAETEYWWLDVIGGGLITLLGFWVSTSDGVWTLGARAGFILLWIGLMALFRGVSDIGLALSLHRLAADGQRTQTTTAPGTRPAEPQQPAGSRQTSTTGRPG